MIKLFIFILLIVGLLALTIDLGWTYNKCPPQKVVYKFVPKTFAEEQMNMEPMTDLFGKMFNDPSPWVASFNDNIKNKRL